MNRHVQPIAVAHDIIAANAQIGARLGLGRRFLREGEGHHRRHARREGNRDRSAALDGHLARGNRPLLRRVAIPLRHTLRHRPAPGHDIPRPHLRADRHRAGVVGDHREMLGRGIAHEDGDLDRRLRIGKAPAHRIARPGLVTLERDAAQPLALEQLVGRFNAVGPPFPLGDHEHVLRLVGNARGVECGQPGLVAGAVPRLEPGDIVAALRGLARGRRPGLALAQHGQRVFVEFAQRRKIAGHQPPEHGAQILVLSGEPPGCPGRLHRQARPATIARPLGIGIPADVIGEMPQAIRPLLAMGEQPVDQPRHQPARRRIAVVQAQQDRAVHDHEAIGLLPGPWRIAIDMPPAIPA